MPSSRSIPSIPLLPRRRTLDRCSDLVIEGFVVFEGNTAQMEGGAIAGYHSPRIRIHDDVIFSNNFASSAGGAINAKTWELVWGTPVSHPPTVIITGNVQCRDNHARSGGCLCVSDTATADISGEAVLESNSANLGGGASVEIRSSLVVSGHVQWTANSAREGGAIALSSNMALVNVSGHTSFFGNDAETLGGAVAVTSGAMLRVTDHAEFHNSSAGVAGAAIFGLYTDSVVMHESSIVMSGNRAPSGEQWDLQTGDLCGDGVLVGPGGVFPQSRPGVDTHGGQVTFCDDGNRVSGTDRDGDGSVSD